MSVPACRSEVALGSQTFFPESGLPTADGAWAVLRPPRDRQSGQRQSCHVWLLGLDKIARTCYYVVMDSPLQRAKQGWEPLSLNHGRRLHRWRQMHLAAQPDANCSLTYTGHTGKSCDFYTRDSRAVRELGAGRT